MTVPEAALPTYNNIEGHGEFVIMGYWRLTLEDRDGLYLVHFTHEDTWGVYDGSPENGWLGGWDGGRRQPLTEEEARFFFESEVYYRREQKEEQR
jgi:hypothetical protein